MSLKNDIGKVVNYFFPTPGKASTPTQAAETFNVANGVDTSPNAVKRNLSNYITPVQLQRIRHDVKLWRDAVSEAELAYYPHRVRMQRMFIDTVLNGHVFACMERRKDLTALRKFEFYTGDGDAAVIDEGITEAFKKWAWFDNFISYSLDALFYGYSLISLGDVINGETFKDCKIVRRWNISPDRYQVTSYIYSLSGIDWRKEPYNNWHVYVPTPSENGVSPCGYGILYKIGIYEILLRNLLGYNADFIELYAQPYRVGKTTKTEESERAQLEQAIQNMGSSGWALIDPMDEIQFLETALAGTGWKGYENLEQRLHKLISKVILGHADALDSIPGKLGNDNEKSPAQVALEDKQTKDGKFIETVVNELLIPRMQALGITLPDGIKMRYKNDAEVEEIRARENRANKEVAEIAQTMKNAGLTMDAAYFTERTGIPAEKIEAPAPLPMPTDEKPGEDEIKLTDKIKNRLKRIYQPHKHK